MDTGAVEAELDRLKSRLCGQPAPFEHAALFAAQQALSWAANPLLFKSPYDLIVGNEANTEDCL